MEGKYPAAVSNPCGASSAYLQLEISRRCLQAQGGSRRRRAPAYGQRKVGGVRRTGWLIAVIWW